MTARHPVPPGRAGRLLLTRRLETARRGAKLLDRKLRILQAELARQRHATRRAQTEWDRRQSAAATWLLRASLLGGQRAIRLASSVRPAEITITYGVTMGIRYPSAASCAGPGSPTWDSPALTQARRAHGEALTAAVRHAAAARALHLIEAETAGTRYRLRAIRDHWIPQLEQALAAVSLAIEEQERADTARLRLATADSLRDNSHRAVRVGQGSVRDRPRHRD